MSFPKWSLHLSAGAQTDPAGSVFLSETLTRSEVTDPGPALAQNASPVYALSSYVTFADPFMPSPGSFKLKPIPAPHSVKPFPDVAAAYPVPSRPPDCIMKGVIAGGVCIAIGVASLYVYQAPTRPDAARIDPSP